LVNALSKLADSESEAETSAPTRKAGGGLLSRLQVDPEDSSESDEEASNRLAERAKQRLMLTKPIDISSGEEESESDDEGAYERKRKQLLARSAQQQAPKVTTKDEQKTSLQAVASSSEDEDDAPVQANRARRLQSRRERTASPPKTASSTKSPSPSVRSRRSSPGLFVTPNASPAKTTQPLSTTQHDAQSTHNADFNERVERIRAERLARLAQDKKREEQKRAKIARREQAEDSDGRKSDGEDGRRLTQLTKPARKAGKKALEAMAREQQRIERGMQLTHQAKTKKRYGTKDLFAKFGYPEGVESAETLGLPTPDTSSLPASPDAEDGDQTKDTPPTSPPSFETAGLETGVRTPDATAPLDESTSLSSTKVDKGKGRAPEFQHLPPNASMMHAEPLIVQRAQPASKTPPAQTEMVDLSDSDEDLKVVKSKSRFPVFDKIPERKAREAPSLLHLRHLAGVRSPGKKQPQGGKSMNFAQLGASLHQKARQQAYKERQEKLEELRSKGIHVETEEEREQRQMEIEDLVAQFEKQRQKDLALAKHERKEAKANGEVGDGLSSDESDDDDYVASGEENAAEGDDEDEVMEGADLELSGSEEGEDEGEEEDKDELEKDATDKPAGLFDKTAVEDYEEEANETSAKKSDVEDEEDDDIAAPVRPRAVHRIRHVVVDDEDDEDAVPLRGSPTQVASQDAAMAAFGFGDAAPAAGLTQAFAGTMANLGSASQDDDDMPPPQEQDSLDFLRSLPDTQPDAVFGNANDFMVPNSQTGDSQQIDSQNGPGSQLDLGISQLVDASPAFSRTQDFNTQQSELPEPTQDAGFLMSRSPAGLAPHSTVDTVMMAVAESPVAQRKGKLRRRRQATPEELSDIDVENVFSGSDAEDAAPTTKAKDVFSVMKKAAKKQQKVDNFNKKTSWARDVIEEQAEESEDEYAGIGGASDDDSDNEADEELAKMIDTSDVKVDERQLAAFYADKSRKDDEKGINQLYNDFKKGNWRKRAAGRAGFDMDDDSEDEVEMRQRKRQREFQQTTRALLQDERIGKIGMYS
jgi:mediator of replication checkpoint protein 1